MEFNNDRVVRMCCNAFGVAAREGLIDERAVASAVAQQIRMSFRSERYTDAVVHEWLFGEHAEGSDPFYLLLAPSLIFLRPIILRKMAKLNE
jgi:hypothetical protein